MNNRNIKIGDVLWVDFNNSSKNVQQGIRPAVVIQNNIGNKYSPTFIVIPLTSKSTKPNIPTHVTIPKNIAGLKKQSIVLCECIQTISKEDILGVIGSIPDQYMNQICNAVMVSMPLIQFLTATEILSMCEKQKIYSNRKQL